jgi:hypothetical protein
VEILAVLEGILVRAGLPRIQVGIMKVVRSTKNREIPSSPIIK